MPCPEIEDNYFINYTRREYIAGISYYTRSFYYDIWTDEKGETHYKVRCLNPLPILQYKGMYPEDLGYCGPYKKYIGRWKDDSCTVLDHHNPALQKIIGKWTELLVSFKPDGYK